MPVIGRRQDELTVIPGRVPNLIDLPAGCRFASRCEARVEAGLTGASRRCRRWSRCAPGHKVRCFLHSDAAEAPVPVTLGQVRR